ncbi:hypothetical protein HMPREF1982_01197 [Clostridiales bacterium oral taxon 876 str. F0540]|nr:hypothetical protein HMPREF1982_01197 [Clostridiales bacterium oral taxon 876 str. F0540]
MLGSDIAEYFNYLINVTPGGLTRRYFIKGGNDVKKYKREIFILLAIVLVVFGFTFKTLVDRNNRNKELAKQIQSNSTTKSIMDANEKKIDALKQNKIDTAEEAFRDKSEDIKIGGIVTNIQGLNVVVRMDTADGSTYYNVEIPHTLKAYMSAIHVNCIVQMTVTTNGKADGMVQATAREIKVIKKAGE